MSSTASARAELIDHLRERGITDERVLHAIAMVPREEFVPTAFKHRAYEDSALPIACGQTISQPYTVAIMTQALQAEPGMRVLEIGTGSGYQAAVLAMLGLKVFTIERHYDLLHAARQTLERIGCNVATHLGDGTVGWSAFAPYDRIVVTAGAPEIPSALLRQLAPDGRLVIPIGGREQQNMQVVVKIGDTNQYDVFDYGEYKFVPLIGRNAWERDDAAPQG
ncbi:MAG: protein-L-isoaspartate(D-aspartate) O-methyltransferase [Bacteroidetes bacterium]|nr:protein-L-isoaspartate(D-aspartate) O-methyltransferase [Bacteroidota bacterium]